MSSPAGFISHRLGLVCCRLWLLLCLAGAVTESNAALGAESPAPAMTKEGQAQLFNEANHFFEQAKYAEAAAAYESLLARGVQSPSLFYNWGNALFKVNQKGRAILAYRQARALAPRDPEIRANLRFVRSRVSESPGRESVLETFSLNEWAWGTLGLMWLFFGLLFLGQRRPGWRPVLVRAQLFTAVILIGTATALVLVLSRQVRHPGVVVVVPEAPARFGPFPDSQNAFTAPDGAELAVLDEKNGWLQVADAGGRSGWITRQQVASLAP